MAFSYPKNAKELAKKLDIIDTRASEEYNLRQYEIEHPLYEHICIPDKILESSKITDLENLTRFKSTNFSKIQSKFSPFTNSATPKFKITHLEDYYTAQRHILFQKTLISEHHVKIGERFIKPNLKPKQLTNLYKQEIKSPELPTQDYIKFIGRHLKDSFNKGRNRNMRSYQNKAIFDKRKSTELYFGINLNFDACFIPHSHMDLGWLRSYSSYWARKKIIFLFF